MEINLKSFDTIAEKYSAENAKTTEMIKIKKKKASELRSKIEALDLEIMDAEEQLEKSIITPGADVVDAASSLDLKKKKLEYCKSVYAAVFPKDKE